MIRFPFPRPKRGEEDVDVPAIGPDAPIEEANEQSEADGTAGETAAPSHIAEEAAARISEALEDEHASEPSVSASDQRQGAPDLDEQERMVEAMLFASEKPLSTAELGSRMPLGCDAAVAVRRLEEMYSGRGVSLARVAGKWAFRTAPDLAHLLTGEAVEQRKLSRAAVETLAIVAYHQPVTRAEIEEIRQVGVSKGTLDQLMELEWIKLGRRRQTPGRPVTFVTTDGFLEHFGLESLKDLPRLEELRQSGLLDSTPPQGFSPKLGGEEGDDEEIEDELDGGDDDGDREPQEDFLV